jgi:hypothetical protein
VSQHPSFKAALHDTVFRSSLPAKALADLVGVSYSTLAQFADDAQEAQIPVRRLVSLVASADNLAVLDHLEALAGRVAFRVPTGLHLASTGEAIRQFGEWVSAHSEALRDGTVSQEELVTIEREGHEAIAAIAAALEHARDRTQPPTLKAVR